MPLSRPDCELEGLDIKTSIGIKKEKLLEFIGIRTPNAGSSAKAVRIFRRAIESERGELGEERVDFCFPVGKITDWTDTRNLVYSD